MDCDNFLTVGCPGSTQCHDNLACLKTTCAELGLSLKEDKVEGPATTLDFLGITIDTLKMEVRLPEDKLVLLSDQWAVKRACRKRELLSLIGKLAHACKIIRGGQIFLRCFIKYSTKAAQLDHWIHLSLDFLEDIGWWQAFVQTWNYQ